ncbi:MAG: hypothetical protein ACI9IT_001307, partial [Glaciecola sp.]
MSNAARSMNTEDKIAANNQFWENIANQIIIDPDY